MLSLDIMCDALRLTDRNTIEKCQLVSRQWNNFITSRPHSFNQRYHFKELHIGESIPSTGKEKKQWLNLTAFQNCCRNDDELKAMANSLNRSYLSPTDDGDICFMQIILFDGTDKPIHMKIPNRFTPSTAFDFLHFMKHLNEFLIDEIHFTSNVQLRSLSTAITTIHCNSLTIKNISQLHQFTTATSLFKPNEVKCEVMAHHLEGAIQRIRRYDPPLQFSVALDVEYYMQVELEEATEYLCTHEMPSTISSVEFYHIP